MRRRRKRRDDKPGKQIQMCVVDNVNYGCANYSFHTHKNATPQMFLKKIQFPNYHIKL